MIDWSQLTGFDWDAGNDRKSLDKHGVARAQAEQMFFNEPLLLAPDQKHSAKEPRIHALGRADDGALLHATFTLRGEGSLIKVISVRPMHRKERLIYEQENKAGTKI